ncbi:MAG TPA: lysophospholipid acyltransferase family protein [Candidatus Limnocylindria bacterium]|nr:lysophospholipid acyltransferase family protein [Candidatus Limnocylindria bacterium]
MRGWRRSRVVRALRPVLQGLAFLILRRWVRLEIVHPERAARIPVPSILIFNYQGSYAGLVAMRALPWRVRSRLAVAADAAVFGGRDRWQGLLISLAVQAFPFPKTGRVARRGLVEMERWLRSGFAVMIAPEGAPSLSPEAGPFFNGLGYVALRTRVPIVPLRLEGYDALFDDTISFPWLPKRSGRVRLYVGEPFRIPDGMDRRAATALARETLLATR